MEPRSLRREERKRGSDGECREPSHMTVYASMPEKKLWGGECCILQGIKGLRARSTISAEYTVGPHASRTLVAFSHDAGPSWSYPILPLHFLTFAWAVCLISISLRFCVTLWWIIMVCRAEGWNWTLKWRRWSVCIVSSPWVLQELCRQRMACKNIENTIASSSPDHKNYDRSSTSSW